MNNNIIIRLIDFRFFDEIQDFITNYVSIKIKEV